MTSTIKLHCNIFPFFFSELHSTTQVPDSKDRVQSGEEIYLSEELLHTLVWFVRCRLWPQLDRNLGAILQEALVDVAEASLAEHSLEVLRYNLQFLVGELTVPLLQWAVIIMCVVCRLNSWLHRPAHRSFMSRQWQNELVLDAFGIGQ